jgi:hypothetical protein
LGGIHGGEEEGERELTGRCGLGRQQRTEWWMTWGAAGMETLPGGGDRQHEPWLPSPSLRPCRRECTLGLRMVQIQVI